MSCAYHGTEKLFLALISTLVAVLLLVSTTSHARTLDEMFTELGGYANTTGPGSLHGQVGNYYFGGSLNLRNPNRGTPLFQITPPSIRGGCGGIDLFAGSFSYVSSDQIVAVLRNIGQGIVSEAFFLALDTFVPVVSAVIKKIQAMAQWANNMSTNTCAIARGAVRNTVSMFSSSKEESSTSFDLETNGSSDAFEARQESTSAAHVDANTQAMKANPATKETVPEGNITWKALTRLSWGGSAAEELLYKELLMSMVGTVIFHQNGRPEVVAPKDIDIGTFIGDNATNNVTINIHRCSNGTQEFECTVLIQEDVIFGRSFRALSYERVQQMVGRMTAGTPITTGDIDFIGNSAVPVYKILTQASADPAVAQPLIDMASDILAVEYAERYVKEAIANIKDALSARKTYAAEVEADQVKTLMDNAQELNRSLIAKKSEIYERTLHVAKVIEQVRHFDNLIVQNARSRLGVR